MDKKNGQSSATTRPVSPKLLLDHTLDTVLRYGCLVLIVVLTTATVLLMRYSRTWDGPSYLPTTAVFLSEIIKLVLSAGSLVVQNGCSLSRSFNVLRTDIFRKPYDSMKLLIPSALYILQSNLLYLALTNLDAATYQVTYQLKVLTTAVFSVCILHKKIQPPQWLALVILTVGVIFVQIPAGSVRDGPDPDITPVASPTQLDQENDDADQRQLLGLTAVLGASFSSGFAGTYFEKLIKEGNQRSIVTKNITLAMFSLAIGAAAIIYQDWLNIVERGFFQGYNRIVVLIILLQAVGGLVVAFTVKYADSILKGFATSISIICSSVLSFLLLDDLKPGNLFLVGTLLVISATFLYGSCSYFEKQPVHKS